MFPSFVMSNMFVSSSAGGNSVLLPYGLHILMTHISTSFQDNIILIVLTAGQDNIMLIILTAVRIIQNP